MIHAVITVTITIIYLTCEVTRINHMLKRVLQPQEKNDNGFFTLLTEGVLSKHSLFCIESIFYAVDYY